MKKKIFLVRLDKIGDLVATLPVDQVNFLKDYEVTWVIDSKVKFLCELAEPQRSCLSIDLSKPWTAFFDLLDMTKKIKPEKIVYFHGPWWATLSFFLAGVSERIGRKSQWFSYLFFTKGLRQSRSQSRKHEIEYNWELLHFAFNQTAVGLIPFFRLQARLHRQLFEKFSLQPKNYIVVHPGMAGSALNWPQKKYNELIESLITFSIVVITGTSSDNPWLLEIAARWRNHPRVRWLKDQLNISELIFILQNANHVIAPSTGVLHMAAAAGTPVVGIYSPVLAHHPSRWGPRGLGARYLLPAVKCPAKISCYQEKCPYHPCMNSISPTEVLALLKI